MKIFEILKQKGCFANDIRQRFKNKQIKLNGEPTTNVDLDVVTDEEGIVVSTIAGNFIFNLIKEDSKVFNILQVLDFETLANSNVDNDLKKHFEKFYILRYSKSDVIFIEKNCDKYHI